MKIKLATFNAENLFFRYKFKQGIDPLNEDGFSINNFAFSINDNEAKRITAEVIKEMDADIICLQEVENMGILERFNSEYLARLKYRNKILIDSHDPRFIDVAVLSRYPAMSIKTHKDERTDTNNAWLFSRDCLKVVFDIEGKSFTVYVNHFKSMMEGREATRTRRAGQVKRVAEIIDHDWKDSDYDGNFAVCGDFNDYIDNETSLSDLVNHPHLVNVVERLPVNEQWTHYYAGKPEVKQLDYLLLNKKLAAKTASLPGINRKGLPWKADAFYNGPRYPAVGENYPKASDHCPLAMEIDI